MCSECWAQLVSHADPLHFLSPTPTSTVNLTPQSTYLEPQRGRRDVQVADVTIYYFCVCVKKGLQYLTTPVL